MRRFRLLFIFLILALAFSTYASAQEATGKVVGTITDQTGAVIPGVHIVVTNTATRITRETTSDSSGYYQVLSLPIGNYTVSASQKGFNPVTTTASNLEINQSLKIDIKLQVGANTQTVIVESTPGTVETINPTMGSTISEREIANAPLNGRNVLDLALLQPGVLPADNPGNGGAPSADTAFSISGGRNDSNTFILDGGANNDLLDNEAVFNPNPDAVQEFRVLTSNFGSEYGRNGGGIITVVTKSGSNDFHGSAFEFNRNTDYDANDFLSNSHSAPRGILKRNQYGGTFGGPLKKNKLFFFLAYQGQRENRIVPNVGTTFTPAELKGDFSGSTNQANVAAFLQANPFFQPNAVLAAQGIIDPTKIDPVAQAYIKAGLIPTSPNGALFLQNPSQDNRDEYTGKFDWEITSKDHITATLGRFVRPTLNPGGAIGAPAESVFATNSNNHRQFFNLAYTRIISPTMLNEFRVTSQRNDTLQATPSSKIGTPQSFGTTITPDNPTAPPLLTFPSLTAGFSPQGPSALINNTFAFSDTFTLTRGKHTLKFGGNFSAYQDNQVFDFFVNGNFDFVSTLDGVTPFAAGDPFANFLVGVPDFLFQAPAAPSNIRTKATYVFAQDEWHVTPRLVLTVGARYEFSTPKSDTKGRTFSIIPGFQSTVFPKAPVGLAFPGDPGAPTGSNFPRTTDVAPRFGFAWQPFDDHKTSVRGGFGMFFDILKAEDNFQFNGQFPFASTAFIGFNDPSGSPAPFGFLTDPFGSTGSPNPFPSKPVDHNIDFAANVGTFGGAGVFFVDPHLRSPYIYQYNLSIERELARKMTVEAAYVGSSSHGLTGLKDINPFDPASLSSSPVRVLNETPGNNPGSFGFLPQFMNIANASYNSMQLALRQQTTAVPILGNMYYTLGYTYAHSIDNASGFRNNSSQVPAFQTHLFRASSDFDLRHVLTFSGGWDLPFSRGPQKLVKGWSVYPLVSWRTGYPFTISAGLPTLNDTPGPSGAGDGALVNANLTGPVKILNSHSQGSFNGNTGFFFFDPTSFNPNVVTGYGTAPRNLLRGPGRTNMDMTLAKTTPIYGDHLSLRLSVDAFNIFNHTQFQSLGTNAATGTLGQVLRTYHPRELQLGAHINF
ncbi:MAG TPA: carboxypeptidase regulatory-like domain-containing protein [Candidatus Angelobacter sp.]|nr:carboxypeptidase regulatory-like domain-containing protein [Candidatus Angelobacter sp.]